MNKTNLERKYKILECLIAQYPILWEFDDMVEEVTIDKEFESLLAEMVKHVSFSNDPSKECCLAELNTLLNEYSLENAHIERSLN